MPLDTRFSLMKQTARTGKPAFESETYDKNTKKEKIEYFDKGNWQKKDNAKEGKISILLEKLKLHEFYEKFPLEMDKIANDNNKIAIIHADGNKMGLMLQQMNKDLKGKSDTEIQKVFKTFSTAITNATNNAVEKAFNETFSTDNEVIKFRPIVIGGDDVTVICDANRALSFTQAYLKAFEENTKKNFKEAKLTQYAEKLTACAGISFCNKKFPFHYSYNLAEHLCGYAKEASNRESSCLISHNIQSSYVEDYKTYIKQELTTKDGVKLLFAPYFTEREPKIDTLIKLHKLFSDSDIPLGKYREWLTELHKSQEYAELFLERVDALMRSKIDSTKYKELDSTLEKLDKNLKLSNLIVDNKTPMQDILQLKSVMGREK
jgi:CRISPR/Cas system-associated protein Cas10 (large subunit of type III CRISPR-Cas system)